MTISLWGVVDATFMNGVFEKEMERWQERAIG
jgi:hypothetical protein